MSQQVYAPSYGYGQETKQALKKPVVISYYPSGNTNNPQRVIAQVETVTREVVKPVREVRSHGGHGQLKREDEFVNKLRDETIKATADLNDASRGIQQPSYVEPSVLSTNLGDHVGREEGVPRSIQPRDHHGNGAMSDGWVEPYDSVDPSHPRKVAALVNRVSNWRGANGYDRGKPSSDTYGSNKGYDQGEGYGGYESSRGKLDESYTGSNKLLNSPHGYEQVGYGDGTNKVNPSSKSGYSHTIGSKPLATQQGYDPYGHNEPRTATNQGYGYGSYGNNAEENGYGNGGRRNAINPQAPVAGSGYDGYTIGSPSKPLSSQEGYQYGYNEPRVGYNGGGEGSHKLPNSPHGYEQVGYGDGTNKVNPSSKIGEIGHGNRGRLGDDDYTRRNAVNPLAESGYSHTIGSKPLATQQGYDQYGHNEPRTTTNQGYGYGSYGNNVEENGYGNGGRRNVVNPQAPIAGSGYGYTGSPSKPLSNQEGYQYGYNEPRVGYNGGGEGSIHKPVASNQLGYNSGLPRSTYGERPLGATSGTVITSVEAVSKYKGTFVPLRKT